MDIRKIENRERITARYISMRCFHMKDELAPEHEEEWAKGTSEDWGAFDEEGNLMAHVINKHFVMNFDGSAIQAGGIGGVSTLPEYREEGCVRKIFEKLLPAAYERGEVLSSLYPFRHAFYRKFGYETSVAWTDFTIPVSDLRRYRFRGKVHQWREEEELAPYYGLYRKFAGQFNMAVIREEEDMKKMIRGTWYKDRYFVYLLSDASGPCAYVAFQDVHHDPRAILRVQDYAFDGRRGFLALLGFLGRFSADYGDLEMRIPTALNPGDLAEDPYLVTQRLASAFMIRVINVRELLLRMRKPAGTDLTIRIFGDEFIPENNRTFRVTGREVQETEGTADISMDIHTLAPLAVGATGLFEASLRPDVEITGNEEMLEALFVRKNLYIADHF